MNNATTFGDETDAQGLDPEDLEDEDMVLVVEENEAEEVDPLAEPDEVDEEIVFPEDEPF